MITVVIPTIAVRADYLTRAIDAFEINTRRPVEILVYRDRPTCGTAWNEGLAEATGDYVCLAADDLEPHPGWDDAAVDCLNTHRLPCPRILNHDGSLQSCGNAIREDPDGADSDVARVPFLPRELIPHLYPVFDNHYAGDYWITWKARQAGWPTVVVRDMVFTHHMLEQGRLDTLQADWAAFQKATR